MILFCLYKYTYSVSSMQSTLVLFAKNFLQTYIAMSYPHGAKTRVIEFQEINRMNRLEQATNEGLQKLEMFCKYNLKHATFSKHAISD